MNPEAEGRVAAYREFLAAKASIAPMGGLEVWPDEVHPILKPHQREGVCWGVRGGRRAWFEAYGLGKTIQQIEALRLIIKKLGSGRGLIVCPLGVRGEFVRDARTLLGLDLPYIRSAAEAKKDGIYLTNYEPVRDGHLDPRRFDVISLDEARVLAGMGSTKTFRELMRLYEGSAAYRFVATATPDPNDFTELLAYAAFLDIMDISQGKTRFFKRDSEHADRLTLLPHMADDFWHWVASWALFLQKPSDLGYSDEGYELPPLDVRWHEVPSPMAPYFGAGEHKDGQGFMFRDAAFGVREASAEKRFSMDARIAEVLEIVRGERAPGGGLYDQIVVWCDLNDEQRAIERALAIEGITVVSLYGSQPVEEREALIERWRARDAAVFLTKPSMYGAGVNLQQCHTMIFAGIGFKFAEVAQGIHRIHRFLQESPCTVHLVHSDAEQGIKARLERKWRQHDEQVATMSQIIRERGLARDAVSAGLTRSSGVTRREARGDRYLLVNNDAVIETAGMASDSVHQIITSVPFSTQYEYSPNINDFGHNDDNEAFWRQMDFLTPELLRVLAPGRVMCIHVKDRITPGGLTGLGFQTLQPFHAEAIFHYMRHGFAFLAQITVVTDVVRENNQTYRLGWTEQCKDGSKMGAGVPEYVLVFRKPPTDNSDGYADTPVVKRKGPSASHRCEACPQCDEHRGCYDGDCCQRGYSRSRWQTDAHGFWRSDGNRPLLPRELDGLPHSDIFKRFRDHCLSSVYDYEGHVQLGEHLERGGRLPSGFMLLQTPSAHPDVWTDVARMRTLNMLQERKGQQFHLCPMQWDIIDRLLVRYSMPGETVYDPFGGLMSVPYCAVKSGRIGWGVELAPGYFADGAAYVASAAAEASVPSLFDLLDEAPADSEAS